MSLTDQLNLIDIELGYMVALGLALENDPIDLFTRIAVIRRRAIRATIACK